MIRIKNLALNLRTQSKVKIRQPLGTLYVRPKDAADRRVLENADYAAQILEESNVKKLVLIDDEETLVKVRFKPDAKKLGPRAGKYLKAIAQALEQADPATGAEGRPVHRRWLTDEPFELAPEEIVVSYEGPANLKCSLEQGTFMALDTALTPELLQEGLARDFNRLIQDQRKGMGLDISDRIRATYSCSPRMAGAIQAHEDYLRNELLAEGLSYVPELAGGVKLTVGNEQVTVVIVKV